MTLALLRLGAGPRLQLGRGGDTEEARLVRVRLLVPAEKPESGAPGEECRVSWSSSSQ